MKNFFFFMAALTLVTSGCTFYHVNAEEIKISSSPEKTTKDILYLETVNVPYEVVGKVTVETERRNSMEEVIEKMKRQVVTTGGDAITNIVQSDPPSPITRIRTHWTGTVIVFKGERPQASDEAPSYPNNEENLK